MSEPFIPVPTDTYKCGVCGQDKPGTEIVSQYYIGPVCKRCHGNFMHYGCD